MPEVKLCKCPYYKQNQDCCKPIIETELHISHKDKKEMYAWYERNRYCENTAFLCLRRRDFEIKRYADSRIWSVS